jgi:curved DNA-binding protein CbpA
MINFYELLEIAQNATVEEINKAYKKLAKKYHPDVCQEADAADKFKQISEANETLSDPNKRAVYNSKLFKTKVAQKPPAQKPPAAVYNPLVKPFYKYDYKSGKILEIWPPGFRSKPAATRNQPPVNIEAERIRDVPASTVDLWGDPIVKPEKGFIDSAKYTDTDNAINHLRKNYY